MTSENEFPQQKVNLNFSSLTLHMEQTLFRGLNNQSCKNITLCNVGKAWASWIQELVKETSQVGSIAPNEYSKIKMHEHIVIHKFKYLTFTIFKSGWYVYF